MATVTNPPPEIAAYRVPWYTWVLRVIVRIVFRIIFYLISRVKITGRENVPVGQAYLIAINHVSIYEPPLVAAFWPEMPEAAGAAEIWTKPGQSFLARFWGGIKVYRGEYDRKLLQTLLLVLKSGYPLLLAPEGGRTHAPGMRRGLPGIAYLMDKAEVPVIPVGIVGSTDNFMAMGLRGKRPQIEMHIGKPMRLPIITGSGKDRRKARQHNVDLIMYQIAELMPPEYRGVYDGKTPLD